MLNRAALLVRPRAPFFAWAGGLDAARAVPSPADVDPTLYLIPEFADRDEARRQILPLVFAEVFANELWEWQPDESAWPKVRDLATFEAWFEVAFHSTLVDLCAFELVDDEGSEDD